MVVVNPNRMMTVTDAKPKLNGLVADAQAGQTTHIVAGGQLAAHIVPPDTWILDDQLVLESMLGAVIRQEAAWAARDEQWSDGQLSHAGDLIGRVLGWTWRTDPDAIFMRAITDYAAVLSQVTSRSLSFADIRSGMSKAFGGGTLTRNEIAAALSYAETHWTQWARA